MHIPSVLLIGPCADSTDVGEAFTTWRWTHELSQHVDITLLTYVKSGHFSARESLPDVNVVEWQDLPIPGRFERLNAAAQPGYFLFFYSRARRWIANAIRAGQHFDLAHQLSPLALRYPSPAAALGIPLIVGPLAGSLSTPPAFAPEVSSDPWFMRLRVFDRLRLRYDPLLRRTYESAEVVLGVAPYVRDVLADLEVREFVLESETGADPRSEHLERDFEARPFRLLFVGRVVRTKGLRDAIRALARLRDLDVLLDVVGDGPDMENCRRESVSLGVQEKIVFHGRQERTAVGAFYAKANAFLFPSFREPSGNVVMEAMSWGLPMIVSDRGGPAHVVGPDAGIRVPARSPEEFATALADAVRRIVSTPALARAQSKAALERIDKEHRWPAKIQRMLALYDRVILGSSRTRS